MTLAVQNLAHLSLAVQNLAAQNLAVLLLALQRPAVTKECEASACAVRERYKLSPRFALPFYAHKRVVSIKRHRA